MNNKAFSYTLIGCFSLIALAIALLSQHVFGMRPCPWCVLQRLLLVLIALLSFGSARLLRAKHPRLASTGGSLTLTLSIVGVISAWYQYAVASLDAEACTQSIAERIMVSSGLEEHVPAVFGIYTTCLDGKADLFGIDYALWALCLFVITGILALYALLSKNKTYVQ